jgi:hypothetical protein
MTAIDTGPYIKSDELKDAQGKDLPPPTLGPEQVKFYDETVDRRLTDEEHAELELRNNLRTILVTANDTQSVILENIRIMRGSYDSLGSGNNAAAIYISRATSIEMNSVEIFGHGQGAGIAIHVSKNVRINNLNIHDFKWSLSPGDRAWTFDKLRQWNWNGVPIYEYRPERQQFAAVRAQERVVGILISDSSDVTIANSRVSELLFPISGKELPWQADGITAYGTTNFHISTTEIAHTWEGIDFTGTGVQQFVLQDLEIKNTFAYGIKVVHGSRSGWILNSNISYSGSNGIVFQNEVDDVTVSGLNINETGVLNLKDGAGTLSPWPDGAGVAISGIGIKGSDDRDASPSHIRIVNSNFNNVNFPGAAQYGILATPENLIHIVAGNTDAVGMAVEGSRGLSTTAYSYVTTVQQYLNIVGCDGPLSEIIWLWDQAHNSVRNPRWTITPLRTYIRQQKNAGVYGCP